MTSVTVFCKMSAYNTNKKYLQKKTGFGFCNITIMK